MAQAKNKWSDFGELAAESREEAKYYSYKIEWSPEDEAFIGTVAEWDLLSSHGNTPEEAFHEIEFAVAAAIEWAREDGEIYPKPLSRNSYSGKFLVRMPPELHRRLVTEAAREGVSLNQFVTTRLAAGI